MHFGVKALGILLNCSHRDYSTSLGATFILLIEGERGTIADFQQHRTLQKLAAVGGPVDNVEPHRSSTKMGSRIW